MTTTSRSERTSVEGPVNCTIPKTKVASTQNEPKALKTYRSRFWVLVVFSYLSWFQGLQWNIWGPLSESVTSAFDGWDSGTVAMIANWGAINLVLFTFPVTWLSNKKRLRFSIIFMAGVLFLAAIFRVVPLFTDNDLFFKIMCHLSAFINGIVGPLALTLPPYVSSTWFPPQERTTATAFGQVIGQLGVSCSFLEPLAVRSPKTADRDEIRSDIKRLMYIYLGMTGAAFLVVTIYYPDKPPSPPSISSSKQRLEFKKSVMTLLRNSQYLLVVFCLVVAIAIPSTWLAVMGFTLEPLGLDQDDTMWIGFLAISTATFVGLLISRITDLLYGHLRLIVLLLAMGAVMSYYWFFFITWGSIQVGKWQAYVSIIVAFCCSFPMSPLLTEIAMEKAFPCSELVAGSIPFFSCNIISVLFLLIFLIPNTGYDWITYLLLAASSVTFCAITAIKEDFKRRSVDKVEN